MVDIIIIGVGLTLLFITGICISCDCYGEICCESAIDPCENEETRGKATSSPLHIEDATHIEI